MYIKFDMTWTETVIYHRMIWNWLANNPVCGKHEWPGWEKYFNIGYDEFENGFRNMCFLCNYLTEKTGYLNCDECPFVTTSENDSVDCCTDSDTPFDLWDTYIDIIDKIGIEAAIKNDPYILERISHYARQVRDIIDTW